MRRANVDPKPASPRPAPKHQVAKEKYKNIMKPQYEKGRKGKHYIFTTQMERALYELPVNANETFNYISNFLEF